MFPHPSDIFGGVARIDHRKVFFCACAVNDQVVDDTALGIAHHGVEAAADLQTGNIIRHQKIKTGGSFFP